MAARLAVLIDAENMPTAHWPRIDAQSRALGQPIVRRLFGDFTEVRLSGWLEIGRRHGLEAVMQLTGGRGKNSADIALTIHAMDLLHAGAVDGFCLASSDRDFVPLATRLVGAGKSVHVLCSRADERLRLGATSVIDLAVGTPTPATSVAEPKPGRLLTTYRKIAGGATSLPLNEAVKRLREIDATLLPAPGSGKVLKTLLASGHFERIGEGAETRIALKRA